MPVVLRYFDARGRAQFIRYFFAARGIDFEDQRVPLSADFSEWAAIKNDRSITGPFMRLPVLEVAGIQLTETLVIASDLHRRFGDEKTLSEQDNRRHATLLSSLYVDLMLQQGQEVWADYFYPGFDPAAHFRFSLRRLKAYLNALDQTLHDWSWLAKLADRQIMLADCLLWDQLETMQVIFGDAVPLGDYDALRAFYEECPARRAFIEYADAHPCQFTGCPGERERLATIRKELTYVEEE